MSTEKYGVLGATGFLGSHVCDKLENAGIEYSKGSRRLGVDAKNISSLADWITSNNITHLINLAADCGGIGLNKKHPARLWSETTRISYNVLEASVLCGINKFVTVGTVCSYAKHCPTPFNEDNLMCHGVPEITNAPYGVAKLNAMFGCWAYRQEFGLNSIYLLPVNLYGPRDNFDPHSSHVIPALIKKCLDAKLAGSSSITCWGTGTATREFLYVEDAADALLKATESYDKPDPVNIGSGMEISIKDLVELIAELVGFTGDIYWDKSKPDGQPRRCLDVSRAQKEFGFKAQTEFKVGLMKTIEWYRESLN